VNVLFTTAGDYNVTLTVSGPDGTNSVSKLVKVSSTSPNLAGPISGSTSICINATSLAYSITPVASAGSYNWTVPAGGTVTSGQGTSSVIASFGTTPGNVCVTASNGCGTGNQICQPIDIAKEQVVFMSYNLLNYPAQSTITPDTSTRNPYFRSILQYSNPDIFVAQEVTGQNGVDFFLNNVLNSGGNIYSAGIFINGFDTDNAIFFKSSKFSFVSNTPIETDLRDISEFKLVHILSGDTIRIYSVHLKASNTSPDEAQRAQEVDTLRKFTNALPAGSNFIVCGDFNIYRSGESAYQKLLAVTPGVDGHFIDPIVMSGTWNNIGFAQYHTQSPRVRGFGGGSTAGLNDRFDLVLFSNAVMQSGGISYVAGSTFPLGNDGNHYNDSINQQPNTAVPVNIADALHYAADHLPVICQLEFQNSSCPIADLGVSSLASPAINICTSPSQTIQVNVKNYGTGSINFAFNNLQVNGQVIHPSSSVQSLSAVISSGILNPGATMMVALTGAP
jgi:endonuclease/exonuclease/phosphatase family metal-dependent hydrolase